MQSTRSRTSRSFSRSMNHRRILMLKVVPLPTMLTTTMMRMVHKVVKWDAKLNENRDRKPLLTTNKIAGANKIAKHSKEVCE